MYAVKFVGETDLPEGHDWVLTQDEDANMCALFVRTSAVTPEVLSEAWAGYRRMTCREDLALPQQRTQAEMVWRSA